MISFKKSLLLLSLWTAAGVAAATPFSLTGVSFAPGTGYGVDATETSNLSTLLDVKFSNAAFSTQSFSLNTVGQSKTFAIGTVQLAESNNAQGIIESERDFLDVKVTFSFLLPGNTSPFVTANGTAEAGSLPDNDVDYLLTWSPITVNFGTSGKYQISLANLSFDGKTNTALQTQNATITLLAADNAVPEPGSIALFGLGMLALGGLRRRQRAA